MRLMAVTNDRANHNSYVTIQKNIINRCSVTTKHGQMYAHNRNNCNQFFGSCRIQGSTGAAAIIGKVIGLLEEAIGKK